jgi:LysR family cys regulon transcriptional activator
VTLQQFRFLCSIVDNGFNITRAAEALHISQPGITQQIQLLERELDVDILMRSGNRLVGLTPAGDSILNIARRIMWDVGNVRSVSEEYARRGSGRLVVGITHVYARYLTRAVVGEFMRGHPQVSLALRQGTPSQISTWVERGDADLGICGMPVEQHPELVFLQGASIPRSILAPLGHPLLAAPHITIEALGAYPIITLDVAFPGGLAVTRTFEDAGIKPNLVLSATDADVIKSYVELGLGVAVLPAIAYEPERDTALGARDASNIFEPAISYVVLRKGKFLPSYMTSFIAELFPRWDPAAVQDAMHNPGRAHMALA